MARKQFVSNEIGVAIFTLNETSVGMGGNNRRRTDVQLIQFYLRQFYKAHPGSCSLCCPKPAKAAT